MERDPVIAERILSDMSDGVMTINCEGRIITFNRSAAGILGITREEVLGRSFAELFLQAEENDDFNQTVLDAIYEASASHNRVVPFTRHGITVTLALTTTFLKDDEEADGQQGVIVVFSDITELQDLQQAEARLTDELKSKHRELQQAYLKTEQSNEQLQAALKKVQVIRIAATAFSILLFLGIGLYVWNRTPAVFKAPAVAAAKPGAAVFVPVTPQPVSSGIALTGKLMPLQMVNLTSPISGKVERVLVRYGDVVTAGQPLLTMDTSEARIKYREAQAAYIKAHNNFSQMEGWDAGSEMARAHRSLAKAKLALENQKKTLDESERLFKKGIIPASEYESAKTQYSNQQMDYQGALEELKAAQDKGNAESRKVSRFELENAEARMKQLERDLAAATVVAPVAGIVMKPPASGQSKDGRIVERSASFQQGELLLAIGDLSGFSVYAKLDEVDVTKVKLGQQVRISGDAFPGEQLTGSIQSISPHAEEGDAGKAAPSFGVRIVVEQVPPELKKRIMVGMTAHLEIIVYQKADALMVPIAAVHEENGTRYVLRRKGATAADPSEKVVVSTGYTTQDAVEITTGLKDGDLIELPGASSNGNRP